MRLGRPSGSSLPLPLHTVKQQEAQLGLIWECGLGMDSTGVDSPPSQWLRDHADEVLELERQQADEVISSGPPGVSSVPLAWP